MEPSDLQSLLTRHARLIHQIAYAYCRNASDREDIVQEVAVQLWRSRSHYDSRFRETTWIYRIALNVAISFHRRERRHHGKRRELEANAITIEPDLTVHEDVERLLRSIDTLGPLDKALVLLVLDDIDHATIADVLGISVSNVGTKLARIKDKLRVALARRSDAHHSENDHGTR